MNTSFRPSRQERPAFLQTLCRIDSELYQWSEIVLSIHGQPHGALRVDADWESDRPELTIVSRDTLAPNLNAEFCLVAIAVEP